jgi:hypothetical protein
MTTVLDQRKIAGVVIEVSRILSDKGFNRGEILIGLSEMVGRIIVDVAENSIQADELYTLCQQHMSRTIHIGSQASEKQIIARV